LRTYPFFIPITKNLFTLVNKAWWNLHFSYYINHNLNKHTMSFIIKSRQIKEEAQSVSPKLIYFCYQVPSPLLDFLNIQQAFWNNTHYLEFPLWNHQNLLYPHLAFLHYLSNPYKSHQNLYCFIFSVSSFLTTEHFIFKINSKYDNCPILSLLR